jgi:tetratricopeptide (TPR) repeat protein
MGRFCYRLSIVLLLVLSSQFLQAQNYKEYRLAMQYYKDNKYEQASEIFEKLYKTNRSSHYFTYYLRCLKAMEEYRKAEKVIKDQMKLQRTDLTLYVELGQLYALQKKDDKAEKAYESGIKKISPDQHQVIRLANSFMANRQFELAHKVYLKGRGLLKGTYGFQIELAQLYYYQRNYSQMVKEYLDLLEESDQYLNQVSNRLQNAIKNDVDESLNNILQQALLDRIKANPDNVVLTELLIWSYVQEKAFDRAFVQARALDLRLNEGGERLMALGSLALNNEDYTVAEESFQYVIDLGNMAPYYQSARNEYLNVLYTRIQLGIDVQPDKFEKAELLYSEALRELGMNENTLDLILNLAKLKAFYLHKPTEAIGLLENTMQFRRLNAMDKGRVEIQLADIYLLNKQQWDATLAYARVETNNKNNPIGFEAKLRKAKLAYYLGNFEWSRAQLDVLKASTSKLIANDAAELALFIFENTGWDSTEVVMEMYSRADLHKYQFSDSLALLTIDSLLQMYPENVLVDEALMLKAELLASKKKYHEAETVYKKVTQQHYDDVLADNALYLLAQLYQFQLNNPQKAMECYQSILTDFKDSIFTTNARKQFRILRGDMQ